MINKNNILYISLDVKEEDKIKLISKFASEIPSVTWYPKFICSHMTMAFHTNMSEDILNFAEENEGKEFPYSIEQIGISDKAIAFGIVAADVPSMNLKKHITLAVNKLANGKPYDSNKITDWKTIPSINLIGKVVIHYK